MVEEELKPLTKAEVLKVTKQDLNNSESFKNDWDTKREVYRNEWAGKKYGNEVKGKSQVVSRDIKAAQTWQHSVIKDPFLSSVDGVKTTPVGAEDSLISVQTAAVLNYQYSRNFNRYNFVTSSLKVLQVEGTVVARVFWKYEEKDIEMDEPVFAVQPVQTPQGVQYQQVQTGTQKVMRTVTTVNKPDARVCKNTELWIDPTEKEDIENAKFVIERWKSSLSDLRQNPLYENIDDISMSSLDDTSNYSDDYEDDGSFVFTDKARKEVDVYEYWGNLDLNGDGIAEPMVCAWVGNTIIRLEESPYSDGKVPFISCAFDADPFSINGESNSEIISTDQKLRTAIKRSFIDTLDKSTNGQRGFQAGTLDPVNAKRFKTGKDFEFQGQSPSFWEGKYNDFNSSVMNFYQQVGAEIEVNTGVRAFNAGAQGAGISAKQTQNSMDATGKREVDISRNYAENFIKPMLRKWHSMNNDFLEPEDIERITNAPYVPHDPINIDGDMDIRIQVNTSEADAEKSRELAFMQQTIGPNDDPRISQRIRAEMFRLRNMPELAQWMEDYRPEPDPMAQAHAKADLDMKLVKIAERQSRAQENQVDMALKQAKVVTEKAKARQLHTTADKTDLDYVRVQDGSQYKEDISKEQQKADNALRNKSVEQAQNPKITPNRV